MIFTVVGNIGSGKTLFLTYLAYLFHCGGYKIGANYHLKFPYLPLARIKSFKALREHDYFLAVDEIWKSADSRKSNSVLNQLFSSEVLQSRKRNAHVGCTTQAIMQLDVRIRNLSNFVFEPLEIIYHNDRPIAMRLSYFRNDLYKRIRYMSVPLILPDGRYICDMYDTLEMIDSVQSDKSEYLEGLICDYLDCPASGQGKIKSYIGIEELKKGREVSDKDAINVANYIMALRDKGKK